MRQCKLRDLWRLAMASCSLGSTGDQRELHPGKWHLPNQRSHQNRKGMAVGANFGICVEFRVIRGPWRSGGWRNSEEALSGRNSAPRYDDSVWMVDCGLRGPNGTRAFLIRLRYRAREVRATSFNGPLSSLGKR